MPMFASPPRAVVLSVRVEVGVLEHLDEEVIRNLWSMLAEDAALRDAVLEIGHAVDQPERNRRDR